MKKIQNKTVSYSFNRPARLFQLFQTGTNYISDGSWKDFTTVR